MLLTVPIAINDQSKLTEREIGTCSGDTCYFRVPSEPGQLVKPQ